MGGRHRFEKFKRLFNAKEGKEEKGESSVASSPVGDPRPPKDPDTITDPQPPPVDSKLPLAPTVWNKYIAQYEEILESELKKDNPDGDSVSLGSSHKERWRQMQRLVEIGLSKTETEAKIYEKVNDGLELFGTVRALVEPAVSAVPQAAIPWVGVCFILEVISNPAKQPGSISEQDDEETALTKLRLELQPLVLDLYLKFLAYLIESVCYFQKNRAAAFLKSVVNIDYWSGKLKDIEASEKEFDKQSQQYNTTESRDRLKTLIIGVKSIERAIDRQTEQQKKLNEDESNRLCLRALYTTNPLYDKERIEEEKGGLLSHCYSWIFLTEGFQTWQQDSDCRLLWIKGDPGKGKTMLLCGIIDRLDETTPGLISCFFCQATRSHQNSATAVLRGIIWSLAHQHPALVSHVRSEFDSAGEQAFNGPNNWEILSSILRRMISDSSNRVPEGTTMVIDALDECTKDNKKLPDLIVDLCANEKSQVRWIVSSRNWVEFQDSFMKKIITSQRVILSLEDNEEAKQSINKAVDAFIEYKVEELERIKETKLEPEVHKILAEKSSSTFLWVALACQKLLSSDIDDWQILGELKGLPSGPKDLYRRILQEVRDSSHASQCRDILVVAALVHRPLSLAELSSSTESLSQHSNRLDALKKQVLRCKGFLVVTGDVVSFMHQSAKDFLLEDQLAKEFIWEGKKEEKISQSVLRVRQTILVTMLETMKKTLKYDIYDLQKPGADVLYVDRKDALDPLDPVKYACCYWADHIAIFDDRIAFATLEFLQGSVLYWLEACSLLGKVPIALLAIQRLKRLASGTEYPELISVLRDVDRFALYFKAAIERFPLQIYASGLFFSPRTSLARQAFKQHTLETSWLDLPISEDWSACVQTLEGHTSTVSNLAFSGNGKCPYVEVHAVSFSSDSSCLASASEDCTIDFWDTKSEEFTKTQTVDTRGTVIIGLVFSPDGEWLASWSCEPKIQIRNAKTGDCIYNVTVEQRLPIGPGNRFSFSSDSQRILLGSEQPGIRDIVSCKWTEHAEIHPERLLTSAFSSDGNWVGHAFGEHGHSIWRFSEADSHRVVDFLRDDGYALPPSGQYPAGRPLPTPQRPSTISNDGEQVATCTEYPFRVVIADTTTGAVAVADPRSATEAGSGIPMAMAWSADSQWLAVGGVGANGQIGIWESQSDQRWFASASEDGVIEIMDMTGPGNSLLTLKGHDSPVYAIIFSHSGKMLATQCAFLVKVWNIEASGECVHTFQAGQIDLRLATTCHWSMAFSADDSQFAFVQGEQTIEVHDLVDQSMYELESEHVSCLVFSPDGLSLAAGDMHGNVKVWDLRAKDAPKWIFESDRSSSLAIAYSSDGKLLAHATSTGEISLWQVATEDRLFKLKTEWQIEQLSFGPDDRSLMSEHGRLVPEYWPSNNEAQSEGLQNNDGQREPSDIPFTIQGYGIGFDGAWLTKDGERIVWLPPEHRPSPRALVMDSVVAIRNSSDELSMFCFDSIFLAHIAQKHSVDATFCCVICAMGIRSKSKLGDQVRSRVFDALNARRNAIAKGPAMAACGRSFLTSNAQQIQEQQDESMTSQGDDETSPLQHEMRSESLSLGDSTGTIPLPTTSTVHQVPGAQITDEACQVGPFYILDDEPTVSPTIDIPQSFNVFPVDPAHTVFEDTFALSPSSMLPGQTSFRTGGFDWLNFDIGNSPQGFQLDTFYNSYIPEFWSSSTAQQVPESGGPNSGDIGNGVQHKTGNGDSSRGSREEGQPDIEQNTLAWPFDQAHKQSPHRYQLPPLRDILNGYCPTDRPRPVQTTLVKGFIQILSENPLPQLETLRDPHSIQAFSSLQRLVDSYFSRFHDIQAIIHKPTWTMSACPPILLTAMASVGALLSDSQSDYELSVALSEICSTMINWMGASDATNYSDVSYLNALCLYQIYSLGSGKRQLYQNADRSRGLLIGGLRGIGLLNPRSSITLSQDHETIRGSEDDRVLANDWKNWIKMESGRRAAWAAFEYDCSLCTLTSRRGIVDLSELPSELPCPESMWNATSARAWFALMSRLGQDDSRPNLSRVLKQALAGRELPSSLGSWAKRLCAQVIGRLLWDLWQIEVVAMPEYLGLGSIVAAHQDTKRSLLKGLNNLVESLSSPSSTSDLTSYNIASLLCHYSHLCAANGVLDLILSIVRGLISTEARVHDGLKVARNRLKLTFARDPKTARRLCWHAAQIVAIANEYLVSAPCEIMRVFMGYIFIIAYSAYGDHTRSSPIEVTQSVRLDLHDQNLSHRRVVVKWIEVGGPASSGSVPDIGADGCVPAISTDAQEILKKLQCWGLAHKFTKVFQVLETKGL
ncbi:heterokaryon incompatibility protein het-E-1 [Fusarium pseudoanthophilum]|uniref:Heterokaryon incompatibility protein het-E-1 n=1 Tax=Fusarium pseudoanthophilum TaxID=48495 RepID=A0A8H5L5J0_9HYPO|nr:heterokaryon incompatibility protein het-E-1 [Fusarium pseudoanthophilum]